MKNSILPLLLVVATLAVSVSTALAWSPRKPSASHYSVRLFTPERTLHTFVNRAKQWYSAIYEDSVYDLLFKIYYFDKPETVQKQSSTFIVLADSVGCFKTSALNFTVLDVLWMLDSFTPDYKGLTTAPESGKQCDTFTDDVELLHYFVVNGTSNSTRAERIVERTSSTSEPKTVVSDTVQDELLKLNRINNGQVDLNPLIQRALKYSFAQLHYAAAMRAREQKEGQDNDRIPIEVSIPMISDSSNTNDRYFSALFEDYKIGERSLPTHAFEVPVPEENCIDLGDFQLRTIRSLLLTGI